MSKSALTLTDRSILEIKSLLDQRDKPALGLRVGIKSGGCSGYKYFVEYADSKAKYDEVVECQGVTIFIDPKALMYLLGSEMDYISDDFKSGFVFINPHEKAKCGCGNSFSV